MGDRVLILLIVVSTTAFFINVALSAIAGATEGVVFKHRTGDVSKRHNTLITPIGWTFMIWNVIFLFVGAAMIYLTVNLCRPNVNGLGKVYCNPAVFSKKVAAAFILNQIFYVIWLFVWDSENMTGSAVILFFIAVTNWSTLILLSRNLYSVTEYLGSNAPIELSVYRILVQNAFGMYTAWTTLAMLLNINVAAIHDGDMDERTSSLIWLSVLTTCVVAWSALALTLWDRFVRYLLTPLLTLCWGLTGIAVKLGKLDDTKKDESHPIIPFVGVLLGITILLYLLQLILMLCRNRRKPLYVASP